MRKYDIWKGSYYSNWNLCSLSYGWANSENAETIKRMLNEILSKISPDKISSFLSDEGPGIKSPIKEINLHDTWHPCLFHIIMSKDFSYI